MRKLATACVATALLISMAAPASAASVFNEIDLQIVKSASAGVVSPGGAFSYTLDVVNNGPSTAPTVEVTDTLPANQSFVSAPGCTHDGSATGGTLTCDLGSMLPNAPQSITINVTMASAPTDGLCSTNIANVADTTGVVVAGVDEITWPDTDLSNNSSSAEVCVPPPDPEVIDLELTKNVDQATVPVGTNVTWTITVVNQGPDAATGVTVSDNLPSGVSYVSDNGGGAFDAATATWTIGNLAVGASVSLQVTTSVDEPGVHVNEAQVATANEDDIDSTPGNDIASEDDQDSAEVGTVLAETTTTTTTIAPTTTVPDTLVKTGPREQTLGIGGIGLAAVLMGVALVLAAAKRD